MDDSEVRVQYVKSTLGTSRQSNGVDSLARQSSLKCVNGDNVIIISDDADEDVDGHSASWICTNCGATNPGSVAQCISCLALQMPQDTMNGEEKLPEAEDGRDDGKIEAMDCDGDDGVWVCSRCTLQNVAESTRCELCEAPRRSIGFSKRTVDSVTEQRQQPADRKDNGKLRSSGLGLDVSDNATKVDVQNADWEVWTCSNCMYNNNPAWRIFCDVCESVKQVYNSPQKQTIQTGIRKAVGKAIDKITVSQRKEKVATSWQCARCSTENRNSVRDCNCCGALRMVTDTDSPQNTWTCTKCTLRNNNVAHVCAACLSKRNTALPQIDDIDMKWPCPKCTCINDGGQNFCQVCGHHRENLRNNANSHQMHGRAMSNNTLQRSVYVKEQQMKEEMVAHDQWMQIVSFCKVVSCLTYHPYCPRHKPWAIYQSVVMSPTQ